MTKCLRIQHMPSNLRNCASYSKLHDGCVSLCTEYISNTKSALHNAWCTRTTKAFTVLSRDIIIRLLVTSPFKTVHFQIFAKIILTKLMGAFLQNLHGWKANRKCNIQLNIKIITFLVLQENAFKVDVNFQISRFPLTLTLTSPKEMKF